MIWKPVLFTVAFSSGSLVTAAIWQYENVRSRAKLLLRGPAQWVGSQIYRPRSGSRQQSHSSCLIFSEGEKIFLPIFFTNLVVYVAWKIPKLQPTMLTYFCSNPTSPAVCWPLVLSTFSHIDLMHLVVNMEGLYSVCGAAVESLGKEQYVGLYMTGGCVASLTSYLYKTVFEVPDFSLGASGAIMAVTGYLCTANPNIELQLSFLPSFRFKADGLLKAVMVFDFACLIFGWKFYDNAAHLGGTVLGIFWGKYGNYYIWQNIEKVKVWHYLRTAFD